MEKAYGFFNDLFFLGSNYKIKVIPHWWTVQPLPFAFFYFFYFLMNHVKEELNSYIILPVESK